jgi:hypothetical protein
VKSNSKGRSILIDSDASKDVQTRIGKGDGNHQTMSLAGLGHAHVQLPAETCAYAEADNEGAARGDGKGACGLS